jgi:hypothetical protein
LLRRGSRNSHASFNYLAGLLPEMRSDHELRGVHRANSVNRDSDCDPLSDQRKVSLMFAAHLAAGLAIKAAQPKAPTAAVLTGAFLPDLFWIGFAGAGIEPAGDAVFFDGWSHSAASIVVQAALFAFCFYRCGRGVAIAVGLAVLSHLPLDALIHPKPIELWPHASLLLSHPNWSWAQTGLALNKSRYWWVQLAIVIPLLAFYSARAVRNNVPVNLIGASCILVLGIHLFV